MIDNKTKIHKYFNFFINIIILVGAYFFIFDQLYENDNLHGELSLMCHQIFQNNGIAIFSIIMILMIVNWTIEAFKWKYLIRKTENLSLSRSLLGIITGITTSIFTPNRIGDFIGKVFILKNADHLKAVLISILGSISQLMVTFFCGSLSIIIFMGSYLQNPQNIYAYYGLYLLLILLNIFIILFYFKVKGFIGFLSGLIPLKWIRTNEYLKTLSQFSHNELATALFLSFTRYLVFNIQLFLLFKIFLIDLRVVESLMISSIIFFILSFIPSFAPAEIGIRGSVAIAVFGLLYKNGVFIVENYKLEAVAAINVLWIINIIFPALIGSIFIFKLKFFRRVYLKKPIEHD